MHPKHMTDSELKAATLSHYLEQGDEYSESLIKENQLRFFAIANKEAN